MKTCAITAALLTLCVASTQAADPARKRSQTQRKSLNKARVQSDESYDPYLGMEGRQLESMSMTPTDTVGSMPMSMPDVEVTPGVEPGTGTVETPEGGMGVEKSGESSASVVGATVSALVTAGAMMLL
mmetsp:Transcript_8166/g.18352  ORF Transcript_8166/g.18352 Transcript_8166/m.18352 type:complete len:128 (+) Transcript_8166:133-516(+)|eukprot:CAMPEP_0172309938 /NCGR_PEP_ID=MMETSP1058-20130122/10961_1 /TAXON_ID=83371 /ORGANISM="Detonula confervacea, Strain CCMP 353" /LENGTH=127 /DNA_ID=CAMNT_0013022661 /DNA_START=57 /DNA_END=440 /DNA_ORIENTATION=+